MKYGKFNSKGNWIYLSDPEIFKFHFDEFTLRISKKGRFRHSTEKHLKPFNVKNNFWDKSIWRNLYKYLNFFLKKTPLKKKQNKNISKL